MESKCFKWASDSMECVIAVLREKQLDRKMMAVVASAAAIAMTSAAVRMVEAVMRVVWCTELPCRCRNTKSSSAARHWS